MCLDEGLDLESAVLLQTFLGCAMVCGSLLFGLIVMSKSQQCLISKQYSLQGSLFGIGEPNLHFYSLNIS